MKLRYYQEDLIKKINNNDIIIINWLGVLGTDFTIEYYMSQNLNKKFGYMGYLSVLELNYQNIKPKYIPFQNLYGQDVDVLIIDYRNMFRRTIKNIIDYCLSHSIKIIIKMNYYALDFIHDYEYVYSNGSITKEIDRREKLKRLLNDNTKIK